MAVAQRVTVLRAGESVATLSREESDAPTLIRLMSGREPAAPSQSDPGAQRTGSVVLRATDLVVRQAASPFDFELRAGEIVGLAGLEGHGQDEFARTLAMVTPPVGGQLSDERNGHALRSRADATRAGVSYVPRDRKSEGIFEPLSILENFSMPTLRDHRRAGLLSRRHMRLRLEEFKEQLRIRLGNELDLITTLSGGNQQKVLISRALADQPSVLVLNDPTRGVDIGAKHDIYRLLRNLAQADVGIVLLSTELEEHILLSERVLVFRDGTRSAELERGELSRGALVAALFGEDHVPRSQVEIGGTL
jgi:ABC-type sugar transport system ATPase subunit